MAIKINFMRNYLIIFLIGVVAACGYPKKEENAEMKTVTIDSMHSYLSTLNLQLPESAGSALSYTHTVMQTMDENRRDSAFILYRQFFYEVLIRQNELLEQNEMIVHALAENRPDVEELNFFKKKLEENGMIMLQAEGSFYIGEHQNYLYDAFSPYVSEPIKKLLDLRKDEMKKGFSEDAALLISYKEVGERVSNWEKLINEYPTLKLHQEANGYYNLYLSTFITGLANSPVFDYQTNILIPEVKEAYEDYINSNDDSKSRQIVSNYYSLLKNNNFKKTPEFGNFLHENNLQSMNGVQPPTR